MLIGITGKAGAGKDTSANHLWRKHGFVRIAFADPLKRAAQEIFGLTDEQTWGREFKEVVIPYWGMSPRRMFQMVGTDAMQSCFGRDVWVKRWMLSYDLVKNSDSVVVPDVRFQSEADLIHSLGGIVIQIDRDVENGLDADAKAHVSEDGLPTHCVDERVLNNDSIVHLCAKIDDIVRSRNG